MSRFARRAQGFLLDEEGAALAEYGILIAFIAIVAIVAVTYFGTQISAKFSELANKFQVMPLLHSRASLVASASKCKKVEEKSVAFGCKRLYGMPGSVAV